MLDLATLNIARLLRRHHGSHELFKPIGYRFGEDFVVRIEQTNRPPVLNLRDVTFFRDTLDDGYTLRLRKGSVIAGVKNFEKVWGDDIPECFVELCGQPVRTWAFAVVTTLEGFSQVLNGEGLSAEFFFSRVERKVEVGENLVPSFGIDGGSLVKLFVESGEFVQDFITVCCQSVPGSNLLYHVLLGTVGLKLKKV